MNSGNEHAGQRRFPRLFRIIGLVSILLIVTIYLYFCPGLNESLVSGLLFHPSKLYGRILDSQSLAGVTREEVFFSNTKDSNSPQLSGWLYRRPESKLIVLFSNGNTGNISTRKWKQECILSNGSSLFAYDYRGFGRSDGIPTVKGVVEDACTAFDYLVQEQGISPDSIVLYGESLGSCMTIEIASKRRCGGIIIQSGCISAEKICKEQVPILNIYPTFLFFKPSLDNCRYLEGSHPPLLIVAGQKDEIIPVEHATTLYKIATDPKELVLLPNSSHNDFSVDMKLFRASLKSFFVSLEKNR